MFKTWLKQQATETTAWVGLIMIVGAFLFPRSVFVFLGIVLIAVDDNIVQNWLKKVSPTFAAWIDEA